MREVNLYNAKLMLNFLCRISCQTSSVLRVQESSGEHSACTSCAKERAATHCPARLFVYECNYGPERNATNKRKAMERHEKKQNVDHSQASVSKLQIQWGHKVDCPTRICVKETFLLEHYQHISVSVNLVTRPRCERIVWNH